MGLARRAVADAVGDGFWKLLGSGTGEGFTPLPNTAVYAILATWPGPEEARRALSDRAVFRAYEDHAAEGWSVLLAPIASRGRWAGRAPFEPDGGAPGAGPLAVITRATIRPRALLKFWGKAPPISLAIGANPHVMFKIGLGEVPWFHQVTFSIWPDAASMAAFAHQDGPHRTAVRAVRAGDWFAEELYARFRVVDAWGRWRGARPQVAQALEAAA